MTKVSIGGTSYATTTVNAQPTRYASAVRVSAKGHKAMTMRGTFVGQDAPKTPWQPPKSMRGTFVGQDAPKTPWQPPKLARTYGDIFGAALWFYESQRAGLLPPSNRVSWRNNSALSDGIDVGVDLTGGSFDATGYVKSSFPLASVRR